MRREELRRTLCGMAGVLLGLALVVLAVFPVVAKGAVRARFPLLLLLLAMAGICATPSPPKAQALDYDCSDFATQAEAQGYLLAGDPYGLDRDDDGIACESLPCPCSYTTPPTPPPPPVPAPVEPGAPQVPGGGEGAAKPTPRYIVYVACGHGQRAPRRHVCPRRSRVGVFFRSSVDTFYTVCVRFPTRRRRLLCARHQRAVAGVLYVNKITGRILRGRYVVTWHVPGRRLVRRFWHR